MYNMYLNKAEEVEMSFCKTYKEDLDILKRAEEQGKRSKKWTYYYKANILNSL